MPAKRRPGRPTTRGGHLGTFLLHARAEPRPVPGDQPTAAFNLHPSIGDERVQILVRDNNVDQALKVLKKKMQREGIFREMKLRGHYEKPSEKKAREKAEAVRRARKLARKRAQREGLVPMNPKPVTGTPTRAPRRARAEG
jgi:small subunit ribosomal protein S21